MRFTPSLAGLFAAFATLSCSPERAEIEQRNRSPRVVSLDYCADQFVLKFVEPDAIAALSTDAEKPFSYLRDQAGSFGKARPRAEDILLLKPDIAVRTYGGGANITRFLQEAGVAVIQIPYASSLNEVKSAIISTAQALGARDKGAAVAAQMDQRLEAIGGSIGPPPTLLYATSKGAAAGPGTLVDELINAAGYRNFLDEPGWRSLPLEALAYDQPDLIATAFFDTNDLITDQWTPSRHVAFRRALSKADVIDIPGAVTACNAWFLVDAVEAMASARTSR